jgi:hypothetical protein
LSDERKRPLGKSMCRWEDNTEWDFKGIVWEDVDWTDQAQCKGQVAGYCGHVLLSITNKLQRYTIFFITVNALHVSGGFSAHHQELRTVHTVWSCQACLLLPLAVATSKFDIYQMLCVQFLSPWWWAEKPPETCKALTVINNIVQRCLLLVILKRIQ